MYVSVYPCHRFISYEHFVTFFSLFATFLINLSYMKVSCR